MKALYTLAQVISFILTTFLLFTLLIKNEVSYEVDWVTSTLNFAKNWLILGAIVFPLALKALLRFSNWEDAQHPQQY